MKIKYFGTAVYEGIPSLFCNCRVCKLSREKGGKNLRTRSQALIDDSVLIDFNADTVAHYQKYNFDWNKIDACLITHSHSDHLYPADLEMAAAGYSHEHRPINFFSDEKGYNLILPYVDITKNAVSVTKVNVGEEFSISNGKYHILPLRANHDVNSSPVIYAIESNGKKILYANDTGMFLAETLNSLTKYAPFDLVSLDCTGGLNPEDEYINGHMKLSTAVQMVRILREQKIIDERTIIVLNHFSHNGYATYNELNSVAGKYGFIVSYDGLEIEF